MVFFRLKFTLNGQPRTALLTDRGWTVIHGDPGMISLLNHICPLPDLKQDEHDSGGWFKLQVETANKNCAVRAAELLKGTLENA